MIRSRAAVRQPASPDQRLNRRHRPDYLLVVLTLVLMVIGLIVVYAISPGLSVQNDVSENYYVSKQLTAIGLGLVVFLISSQIHPSFWKRLEKPLIIGAVLAALAAQLFGEEINGAARWIQIGGLSFQAVELIKLAFIVWLAGFLSARLKEGSLTHREKTFKPLLIVIGLTSLVVAVFQSDLGSTGVIVAIAALMAFIAGLPMKKVLLFGLIVVIGTMLAIFSSPYRQERLATFANPGSDCQDAGYQACQALSAIGSGGMFGKGINRGVSAYGYLPESANDSIFAVFGEMFGFVGTVTIIGLFVLLFSRLKLIMERSPNLYTRLLMAGILAWLSTQALINIGSMIGLLPLKGITLPFVSYGGTSIIFVAATIGIAFNISRYTTYSANNTLLSEGKGNENSFDWRRHRRPHNASTSRRA